MSVVSSGTVGVWFCTVGASLTGLTETQTVATAEVLTPSVAAKLKQSLSLQSGLGVYLYEPFGLRLAVPLVGGVMRIAVSWSPSGSFAPFNTPGTGTLSVPSSGTVGVWFCTVGGSLTAP